MQNIYKKNRNLVSACSYITLTACLAIHTWEKMNKIYEANIIKCFVISTLSSKMFYSFSSPVLE